MLFAAESQNLSEILRNLPISTHIASILKQTNDLRSVIGVLQMAFVLLHKMPELFTVQFQRQGVVFQVKKLLEREQSMCTIGVGTASTPTLLPLDGIDTPLPPASLTSMHVLDLPPSLPATPANEPNTGSIGASSSSSSSAAARSGQLAPIEKRKKPVPTPMPSSGPFSNAAGELLSTGFLRSVRHSARGSSTAAANSSRSSIGQRPLSMCAQMDSSEVPASQLPDAAPGQNIYSRTELTGQTTSSAARTSPMNFLSGVFHRRTSGNGEQTAAASTSPGLTTFTFRSSSSKTKGGEATTSSSLSPRPVFPGTSSVIPSIWRSSQSNSNSPQLQPLNSAVATVGASSARLTHRLLKWDGSNDTTSNTLTTIDKKLPTASSALVPASPPSTLPKTPSGPRPTPAELLDSSVLSLGLVARPLPSSLLPLHSSASASGQLRQQIDVLSTKLKAWIKQHAEQFLRDFDEKCSACAALIESSSSTIEKLTSLMGKLSDFDAEYVILLHELSKLLVSTDISAFEMEHSEFVAKLLRFLTRSDDALTCGSSFSTASASDTSYKQNSNPSGVSTNRALPASKKTSNASTKARLKLSDAKPPKLERVSEVDSLLDAHVGNPASSSGEGSSATASSSASSTPTADQQQRASVSRVERLRWFLAVLLHDPHKLQQRLCELAAASRETPAMQPPLSSLSHSSSVSSSTSLVLPFSCVSGDALSHIVLDSRTNGSSLDTNYVHNSPFNRLVALLINLLHYEEQFTLQIVEFRGAQSSTQPDNGNNRLALPTLRVCPHIYSMGMFKFMKTL